MLASWQVFGRLGQCLHGGRALVLCFDHEASKAIAVRQDAEEESGGDGLEGVVVGCCWGVGHDVLCWGCLWVESWYQEGRTVLINVVNDDDSYVVCNLFCMLWKEISLVSNQALTEPL